MGIRTNNELLKNWIENEISPLKNRTQVMNDLAIKARISDSTLKKVLYMGKVPSSAIRCLLAQATDLEECDLFPYENGEAA